jgi:hypothetical protein
MDSSDTWLLISCLGKRAPEASFLPDWGSSGSEAHLGERASAATT